MKRFWGKVDIRGPDECWPWTAGRLKKGYGRFRIGSRQMLSHRVAFSLSGRVLKDSTVVRHTCDNPPCCNPRHLIGGTHQDNSDDCVRRGRRPQGEKTAAATLTETAVLEIRRRYAALKAGGKTAPWGSLNTLAEELEIGRSLLDAVVHRHIWRHI